MTDSEEWTGRVEKLNRQLTTGERSKLELEQTESAFDILEQEYVKAWRATSVKQEYERERLWQALQILDKVRSHLRNAVANGKLAEKEIQELKRRKSILGL